MESQTITQKLEQENIVADIAHKEHEEKDLCPVHGSELTNGFCEYCQVCYTCK